MLKGTLPNGLAFIGERLSGELAFELHCRPSIALPPWEALVESGLAPYGLEALDILRVEKGYLVSFEINGQTTPFDLGMSGLVKLGNPCVGWLASGRRMGARSFCRARNSQRPMTQCMHAGS